MQEKEEQCTQFSGVLIGIVECENGSPFIAMGLNDQKVVLYLDRAIVLFDQLGNLIESLGGFDGDEEDAAPEGETGGQVCH